MRIYSVNQCFRDFYILSNFTFTIIMQNFYILGKRVLDILRYLTLVSQSVNSQMRILTQLYLITDIYFSSIWCSVSMDPCYNIDKYLSLSIYICCFVPSSLYIIFIFCCLKSSSFLFCASLPLSCSKQASHFLTFQASHKILSVLYLIDSDLFIILNNIYFISSKVVIC